MTSVQKSPDSTDQTTLIINELKNRLKGNKECLVLLRRLEKLHLKELKIKRKTEATPNKSGEIRFEIIKALIRIGEKVIYEHSETFTDLFEKAKDIF